MDNFVIISQKASFTLKLNEHNKYLN